MTNEIKERPMLFKGDMVRGIMREIDPKTQTRRIVDPQPEHISDGVWLTSWQLPWIDGTLRTDEPEVMYCCRHGKSGDRLWVKETFCPVEIDGKTEIAYRASADDSVERCREELGYKWTPSIFMHRYESRIDLEILDVRIERVQEISADDAIAEGIDRYTGTIEPTCVWRNYLYKEGGKGRAIFENPIDSYRSLWDFINAKPSPVYDENKKIVSYVSFPWEEIRETRTYRGKPWIITGNPHVWVIKFKRVK